MDVWEISIFSLTTRIIYVKIIITQQSVACSSVSCFMPRGETQRWEKEKHKNTKTRPIPCTAWH